ncbi:hypothetical protein CANMA_002090 [Candida margitis]|uniref:uncharacterized protein n=1 Tax=Candida margitis TaxID=1775924 RepID=UPI00222714D7|nr:uncharacterized protein CANMA_002090 [Candida margitis]KAI5968655.1 hypothetical protein CANMA_002090 [Candida margitis]
MTEASPVGASLLRLKLLDALRSGDTSKIDAIVGEINSSKTTIQNQELNRLKSTILHYAVQVATLPTIQYLANNAEKYGLDINSQDPQGNTPLHLAAIASRQDVVKYLLSLPDINDTIVNLDKKQPVELCKNLNIAQLMQFERAKFVEKSATQLRAYFSNRDFDNLERLLVLNPRASELLDINGADPESGNTVLHEFIKKDDIQMCDWILKHGGDPFKRDKHGRLPIELVNPKDEPLKKLIKAATRDQTIMDPVATTNSAIKAGNAPVYKGYLNKWTNFASGYKLRYFVLDPNGILSYYTNQEDTMNSCRGSLNLGYATLHLDSSEKMKFEIYGKNGLRWHLKANHPIETNRWVWTLQNAITIAKDNIKKKHTTRTTSSAGDSPSTEDYDDSSIADDTESVEKKKHRFRIPGRNKHKRNTSQVSKESVDDVAFDKSRSSFGNSRASTDGTLASPTGRSRNQASRVSLDDQHSAAETDHENFDHDYDGTEPEDEESDFENDVDVNQLNDDIAASRRALQIELSSLLELFSQIMNSDTFQPNSKQAEVCIVGNNTIRAINELLGKYNINVDARDSKLRRNLDRQLEVNQLWEKSIRQLENEIQAREEKLAVFQGQRKQLRKYLSGRATAGSETGGTLSPVATNNVNDGDAIGVANGEILSKNPEEDQVDQIDSKLDAVQHNPQAQTEPSQAPPQPELNEEVIGELLGDDSDDEFFDADEFEEEEQEMGGEDERQIVESDEKLREKDTQQQQSVEPTQEQVPQPVEEQEQQPIEGQVPEQARQSQPQQQQISEESTAVGAAGAGAAGIAGAEVANHNKQPQDEDIGPNEIPGGAESIAPSEGTKVDEAAQGESPATAKALPGDEDLNPAQREINHELHEEGSYLGYENPPRKKLALDEDNRPKVGLWGILKSMIGKDMTRMTLPVSFNEPTSLLQRLAEDIEYNNLLNTAAGYDDSTLRLVYVATFAATEYSSTIDRIAKPFNPLLGETFEYSRPDQNYRLFVEQVSHHPPISACHATSPKWEYYGENAVDSKFYGRSFDFKHLGKMFCVVRPNNGVKDKNGNVVAEELYSWKKVNTAVVGIMVGNPTVDNYGKMVVENHTTGDIITVDMKQRGWRASSAYQLSGQALDRNGTPQWALGGHWNSKIFAKKINKDQLDSSGNTRKMSILEDPGKSGTGAASTDPYSGSKFLVWQAAPRPKVPFNLTQFALTLNGIDDKLKPWLAPTDTRLRPDQRDMENGKYDRAADEKHRVEVKQRQARKYREEHNINYVPNWFIKKKHPVTGDSYWEYNGKYWPSRKQHKLKGTGDIF